jgi:hypothetical protein
MEVTAWMPLGGIKDGRISDQTGCPLSHQVEHGSTKMNRRCASNMKIIKINLQMIVQRLVDLLKYSHGRCVLIAVVK